MAELARSVTSAGGCNPPGIGLIQRSEKLEIRNPKSETNPKRGKSAKAKKNSKVRAVASVYDRREADGAWRASPRWRMGIVAVGNGRAVVDAGRLPANRINQLAESRPVNQLDRFSDRKFNSFTRVNTARHENRAIGALSHQHAVQLLSVVSILRYDPFRLGTMKRRPFGGTS